MVRDPMDTCFSNLRTLFIHAGGYSYEQTEMADYFLGYQALMAHWHRVLPGRVMEVDYAALVDDPERIARKVFVHCGQDFEPKAVENDRNAGGVSTERAEQEMGRGSRRVRACQEVEVTGGEGS